MATEEVKIDESLYSRQQLMMGEQAMKRMAVSNVFVSGISGLGVEIAKNVALAGVKSLTLHDSKVVAWSDLSTNFCLKPEDIGKNRAEVCVSQISQLNPYTKCTVSTASLSNIDLTYFDQFKCVILTDSSLDDQLRINDYCHAHNICFIVADVRGVFTWTFCDFGPAFEIFDKNGEENRESLVGTITRANPGVVTTLNQEKHGFEDGDYVTFREVKGMSELNGKELPVTVINPMTYSIGDTTSFGEFQPGYGIAAQIKKPFKIQHASLRESLPDPALTLTDFAKMEAPGHMHVGMQALHAFARKHNAWPRSWNAQDADEVISLAKEINGNNMKNVEQLDENLLRKMSYTCQGSIVPLTSFTGGVVAQECLKALSGKYTPLTQWMYLDGVEVLPKDISKANPASFQPAGNRLDGQIVCLGKELCDKLANLKLFMIGCGAIGCEMLKNYAMLGVATGEKGLITVTDNDLIEKSNLNRQFLFREHNLQKPKSESAAIAAQSMNPQLKVVAHLDKVGPDTEAKYDDVFFTNQDIIVNALDNINARLYVDSRCVTNKRPLLESGTLGPKGHVQVVIPFKTESYGSQRDPPEKDVPFCTLKSFPNLIEHCIEWARDFSFGGLFVSKPMQWNQLLDENNVVERLGQPNGGGVDLKVVRTAASLLKHRPANFDDCIVFARQKFQSYFVNKSLQLLHNYPLDHKIDDKGTLFWSSPKRPPTVVHFDWNDPHHQLFVVAFASLWAEVWNLPRHTDLNQIKKVVNSVVIPPFAPKEGKKIETDESKTKEEQEKAAVESADDVMERQLKEVRAFLESQKDHAAAKLKAIDFEKDDDTNFHIDFISSTANLRARVYSIPEVDRLKVKAIAGRIMPAIATTTAAVSGCVSLELIKLAIGYSGKEESDVPLDHFKNLFMNLALPFWSFSEPGPAEKKKIIGDVTYTLWDRWEVAEGDITLGQFLDIFQQKYGLGVDGLFKGVVMIYVPMFPAHLKRKTQKMSALLKSKPGTEYEDLVVTFTNEKGDDISGPPVRFYYNKK